MEIPLVEALIDVVLVIRSKRLIQQPPVISNPMS